MKRNYSVLFMCMFILSSCSLNNNDDLQLAPLEKQTFQWHLTNTKGGIAGVDTDYEMGTIIWVFNVNENGDGTLIVQNNNTDETLQDGLDTGSYNISMPVKNSKSYLFLETHEFGEIITPTQSELIIDQNKMINASGADGFIYTFKRTIIAGAE
ncbi:hypothetical protein ACFFU9_09640 [Mariniflexile ostreae]|uniref:Lipoprotein n=1 Tax=Mariniflexile ostreae TaxID=1520892 RepID=A0ABV5FC23_9FLAO